MSVLMPCPGCGQTRNADDGHALCRPCEGYQTCEVPGCNRLATESRPQQSGEVVKVCGHPHVYGDTDGH